MLLNHRLACTINLNLVSPRKNPKFSAKIYLFLKAGILNNLKASYAFERFQNPTINIIPAWVVPKFCYQLRVFLPSASKDLPPLSHRSPISTRYKLPQALLIISCLYFLRNHLMSKTYITSNLNGLKLFLFGDDSVDSLYTAVFTMTLFWATKLVFPKSIKFCRLMARRHHLRLWTTETAVKLKMCSMMQRQVCLKTFLNLLDLPLLHIKTLLLYQFLDSKLKGSALTLLLYSIRSF